jgi:hypothetical protein
MANTNKWDEAVMRLHRRYIAAGKMKRATRLIIRAKLQLKFALVRKLQQQSDALVAAMNVAPRCVVCRCNNIAFDGPVCNEHASWRAGRRLPNGCNKSVRYITQTARQWTAQSKLFIKTNWMMNHDNPNEQTIEYQFGYLRAAIAGAMLLRNVQQMKSTLGDALDHINDKSL